MATELEPYLPCHRCRCLRPRSKLLAGACADGFCAKVFDVTNAAERHRAWWLRRYTFAAFLSEDIFQESALAAWRAMERYEPQREVAFSTYAFGTMRSAVRQLLRRQLFWQPQRVGDVYEQWDAASPSETDRPTLLRQCADSLAASYRHRGARGKSPELLVLLEAGETQADAARLAGVSRQRAKQVHALWGPDIPSPHLNPGDA